MNRIRRIHIGTCLATRRSFAKSGPFPSDSALRSMAMKSDRTAAGVMRIIETFRSLNVRRMTAGWRLVG